MYQQFNRFDRGNEHSNGHHVPLDSSMNGAETHVDLRDTDNDQSRRMTYQSSPDLALKRKPERKWASKFDTDSSP